MKQCNEYDEFGIEYAKIRSMVNDKYSAYDDYGEPEIEYAKIQRRVNDEYFAHILEDNSPFNVVIPHNSDYQDLKEGQIVELVTISSPKKFRQTLRVIVTDSEKGAINYTDNTEILRKCGYREKDIQEGLQK